MGMNMRFVPAGKVDLTWPPRVMGFSAGDHSFRLAKGYRRIIARITGIHLHDEMDLEPNEVLDISKALEAVARNRLRREAAVHGQGDPLLEWVTRKGIPPLLEPMVEWRLLHYQAQDNYEALNELTFEQLVRMFSIYASAGSRLVGY